MGKGHIAVNNYIRNKRRFADMINGGFFGGKQIVLPEQLEEVSGEYEMLLEDKKSKTTKIERYRDVIMRWNNQIDFCFLACENQEEIHYAMPVRDMLYDGLAYTRQIVELWKSHNKGVGQDLETAEYLSKFRKGDKIFPVLTIVFYYGSDPWDGNQDLYSMFQLSEPLKDLLKEYVPNYWINLFAADNIENLEYFKTDLQKIIGMLKCKKDMNELKKYVHDNEDFFGNVDYNTQQAISEFLQSEQFAKKMEKKKSKEAKYNMCKALDDLYQEGIEKGIEKGRAEMQKNFVETYQELGQTKELAISKFSTKFNVSLKNATAQVNAYWQ